MLSGAQVESAGGTTAVVVLGNSIADGRGSGTDRNDRWPDNLARRLAANEKTANVAMLNAGIGGNAILRGGLGPTALARLDRDVLDQPGAHWLIVSEGVNDIGGARGPDSSAAVARELIGAYREIITRAHARGLQVYGATILPFMGSQYGSPDHEAARQTVNRWIRESGAFDGVFDLDVVMRDPVNPSRLRPGADTGDHLHPNELGYRLLASAIDLRLFEVVRLVQSDSVPRTWTADNGNGTFSNPLFYDEFSDPDLIRVGDDYYLTGTTMHAMPGLPVLHSRDLVNWELMSYALDRLDLGPGYRLEGGEIYGQGIWAPSFRYHAGTFHIFTNVNGQTTQHFTATNPRGPWTRTPMKRSLHDLSVLFDDDGEVYVVWGYQDMHFARLDSTLTDIVPGTERVLFAKDAGMGEGAHFYKIDGKYYITSAWYRGPHAARRRARGSSRRPVRGEQGDQRRRDVRTARRLSRARQRNEPEIVVTPGNPTGRGHMSMHQGGIVRTPRRRVVGLLDDGREFRRAAHGALARDVEGRLAILRSAGKSRAHAAHLGEAEDRARRARRTRRTCATTSSPVRTSRTCGSGITCPTTRTGR